MPFGWRSKARRELASAHWRRPGFLAIRWREVSGDGECATGRRGEDGEVVSLADACSERAVEAVVQQIVCHIPPVLSVAVDERDVEALLPEERTEPVRALVRTREEYEDLVGRACCSCCRSVRRSREGGRCRVAVLFRRCGAGGVFGGVV